MTEGEMLWFEILAICSLAFIIKSASTEIQQFIGMENKLSYFKNIWNILDILYISTFILISVI